MEKRAFSLRNMLGQLAAAVVVVVAFLWLTQVRRVPTNLVAARDCENYYAAARTDADSAQVDQRELVFQDPASKGAIETCGGLRQRGRLK